MMIEEADRSTFVHELLKGGEWRVCIVDYDPHRQCYRAFIRDGGLEGAGNVGVGSGDTIEKALWAAASKAPCEERFAIALELGWSREDIIYSLKLYDHSVDKWIREAQDRGQ